MTMPLSLEFINHENKMEQREWLKCKRQCVINRYYSELSQACSGLSSVSIQMCSEMKHKGRTLLIASPIRHDTHMHMNTNTLCHDILN